MKKWKSTAAFALCLCMFLSTSASACWFLNGTGEPENPLGMTAEQERDILTDFGQEISWLEEKYGMELPSVDDTLLELAKREATEAIERGEKDNPYGRLVDAICLARALYDMKRENSAAETYRTERPIITVKSVTTAKDYGILKGKYITEVPVGVTSAISGSSSVEISSGESIQAFTISGSLSVEVSYSIAGPADGTTLSNGRRATHRSAMGVLYGTIMKKEYEIYYPDTGYVHEGTAYYIDSDTTYTCAYTFLSSIGIPTYADNVYSSVCFTFKDNRGFLAAVESTPAWFIQ